MKLSHFTAAVLLSVSAISSATAQAQTISVNPQTLVVNIAAGENMLARIAQSVPGYAPAVTPIAATPASAGAPAAPVTAPAAPVTVPAAPAAAPAPAVVPTVAAAAPAYPAPVEAPVEVPSFIGGQKIGADAQRVTKCLIETHGNKYICGMQELNGEIAKCVGGVGIAGGCFTAPLTRPVVPAAQPRPRHHSYPHPYFANYINIY